MGHCFEFIYYALNRIDQKKKQAKNDLLSSKKIDYYLLILSVLINNLLWSDFDQKTSDLLGAFFNLPWDSHIFDPTIEDHLALDTICGLVRVITFKLLEV